MAFEDRFIALRNDEVGELRREKPAHFAGALDLDELRRDARLQFLVPACDLLVALAQFAEETCVLHRYDRLRREVFDQRDLLVRKRPDLAAEHDDSPQERVFFAQRYAQPSTNAVQFEAVTVDLVVAIGRRLPHIRDVHNLLPMDYRIKQAKTADRTELLHLFDDARIAAVD